MKFEPGYKELADVLQEALNQAQHGKGKDRHATDKPFLYQPMMTISRMSGVGGPIYQAMKKAQESMRLMPDAAVAECLGAINYLAGAVLIIREKQRQELGAGAPVDHKAGVIAHGKETARQIVASTIIGRDVLPLPYTADLPHIVLPCTAIEAEKKYAEEFSEWMEATKGSMEELVEMWDRLQAAQTWLSKSKTEAAALARDNSLDGLWQYEVSGRRVMVAKATMLLKNAERGYYAPEVNAKILFFNGARFASEPAGEGAWK